MGLCKCPKRKTTSHFCFHHCVNVCEHCIVNNHATCVVKSYTTWLKESSGNSMLSSSASALCAVCQKQFVLTQKEIENLSSNTYDSNSNTKTAIRLLCYHIVHARCLSVSVKKQLKEGNIVKCPSCARPFWTQQEDKSQDSNDIGDDANELSPVALQLYKYLLNHGDWWGQALISNNGNVKDIEKFLLDDEDLYEENADQESQQLFENLSTKPKTQFNNISNNVSPSTLVQTIQSPNCNTSYYNLNNSDLIHTTQDLTTVNHRNTYQASQPIYNRHFNNNYGIDSVFVQQQQQQQQQQCSTVNMTTIAQGSDLSNRHTTTSSTPLLLNNDTNSNFDEEKKDPSSKYRPKKFNNQPWFSNYQRLLQYFCGTNNRSEDSSTTRIAIIIIFCIFVMVILLVAITNYTRSNNEPFDNNSIDYGGGENQENIGAAAHVKNYNINNL